MKPSDPRPLSEQELVDWQRWCRRDIAWKGSDIARLIATVRAEQERRQELERQLQELRQDVARERSD